MFIPLDEVPVGLRPPTSGISPNDWRVLARFWYPVAVDGDVKQAPVRGKLLDVDLVIYRTAGQVSVALDVCPHRHIRLSAGRIADNRLVCSFHGLAFDAAGECTMAPALGRQVKLPASYRLHSIRSQTRYGLIWACLDDKSAERVPDFPAGDESGLEHLAFGPVRDWPCSAARQVENFTDIAHLPFVHPKSIGGDPNEVLRPAQIESTKDGFVMVDQYLQTPEGQEPMLVRMTYRITMPFMIDFTTQNVKDPAPDVRMINFPAPISAHQCRVFSVFALYEPSPSNESQPGPGDTVNSEDIEILKHLARPDLPLDQKWEIHIPLDNSSMEYRKHLRELGLGRR
jgi:phenylpropionate dioxygenase-like ring-hydroxylating dioxygenase large terminal subunit